MAANLKKRPRDQEQDDDTDEDTDVKEVEVVAVVPSGHAQFFHTELEMACSLLKELFRNPRQRWLREQQAGNYVFLLCCTTTVIERLALQGLDLSGHLAQCRLLSTRLRQCCGVDNRLALIQTLFPHCIHGKVDATLVPDPVGDCFDLGGFFDHWAMSIVRKGDTNGILFDMLVHGAEWKIDVTPKARGFLTPQTEDMLYFYTHVIYFATCYGTRPFVGAGQYADLARRLLACFHAVQDPNKEVKMELAAAVIMCRIPDAAVRKWVKALVDPFVYTPSGCLKYQRSSVMMYQLHSHAVFLHLKAIALAEELEVVVG